MSSTSGFDSNSTSTPTTEALLSSVTKTVSQRPGKANSFSGGLFLQCLLSNLRQGVIIIDAQSKVLLWNPSIEDMTGVGAKQAIGKHANPALFNLTDSDGKLIDEHHCPFAACISTRKELRSEFRIMGRSGREVKAEFTIIPVIDQHNAVQGAVILVYDESIQVALKRKLQDLHHASTLDPLTQVANRAEFERVLEQYVKTHQAQNAPCSLIVADIDFFKSINDNYGHHIGDQSLSAFARLMKKFVRNNDLVARFGGEEFVILCANCDSRSAVERAEEIRLELNRTPQSMLDGKCLTASFGVSELKADDSGTDIFVRADKALLKAKELGRNQVVEASTEETEDEEPEMIVPDTSATPGIQWRRISGRVISTNEYKTTTPLPVLVQKLSGFIQEVDAELINVDENHTTIQLVRTHPTNPSRKGHFIVDIELHELEKKSDSSTTETVLRITMRPQRTGFFTKNATDVSEYALRDIRQFLMLKEESTDGQVEAAATESGRD